MDTKKITYMAVALMWLTTTENQAAVFKYCGNTAFSENKVSLTDVANKIEATDTSRVYNLDEVVIVSQPKEALLLRQQPLSSSMFTGNDINSLGITDLSMLASYVPSFAMPAYDPQVAHRNKSCLSPTWQVHTSRQSGSVYNAFSYNLHIATYPSAPHNSETSNICKDRNCPSLLYGNPLPPSDKSDSWNASPLSVW